MYSSGSYKNNRYLTTNTSHNIPSLEQPYITRPSFTSHDDKHTVFNYPKTDVEEEVTRHHSSYSSRQLTSCKRNIEHDDSLTSMEWLTEVSPLSYIDQVRFNEAEFKRIPRKRNRSLKDISPFYDKPPYSYAMLIYKAINDTHDKRMQLFQIYEWIENHFDYYKHTPGTHWKSSIRHNLSLHKIFVKESPPPSLKSKGSFWALDRRLSEEALLQSLQPKRPRLSRVSGGETGCTYTKNPYYHSPRHPITVHQIRQPQLAPIVQTPQRHPSHRAHVQIPASNRLSHFNKLHKSNKENSKASGKLTQDKQRPNILSKVIKKENSKENQKSSPVLPPICNKTTADSSLLVTSQSSATLNLNQLFHNNYREHNSSISDSYESGYASHSDSPSSPKSKIPFVCSTPIKTPEPWSSPEFQIHNKLSPRVNIAFPVHSSNSTSNHQNQTGISPLVKDNESWSGGIPNLSQYLDSLNDSQLCLREEQKEIKQEIKQEINVDEGELDTKRIILWSPGSSSDKRSDHCNQNQIKKEDDKVGDISELINQFINEGEVCMLNGTLSTTPLRQYLNEEETDSSICLDLDSPKIPSKSRSRRSLNIE